MVDPEGSSTSVKVQYIDETDFDKQVGGKACKWSCVSGETAAASIGSSFADQHVVFKLPVGKLTPGARYRWRLVGSSAQGTQTLEGALFEEIPAMLVEGPWAAEVASTSATLAARIDPRGVETRYRLEYGTSTVYENVLVGNVSAGEGFVPISYHRQGLSPDTVYHFRLVATNEVGGVEVVDRTFITQPAVALGGLPDGRAWELVSPPDKHGALIEPTEGVQGDVQAAEDGSAIGYVANQPVTDHPPANAGAYVLTTRGVGREGWSSQEIMPSQVLPENRPTSELTGGETPPMLFSPGMERSVIEPGYLVPPSSLSPEATERTIFLRDTASGAWTPLVTPADDETGEHFLGARETAEMQFLRATPDLSHIVFETPYALTTGSSTPPELTKCLSKEACSPEYNLYEWSGGRLAQVNILPGGTPTFNAFLGRQSIDVVHALSDDGRWVALEYQDQHGGHALYVRDMVEHKTMRVAGSRAVFETLTGDGSRLFFLDGVRKSGVVSYDLYEFNTGTGVTTDVTAAHGAGESSAGVKDAVVGTSKDGSYVYFVADGVLAEGAVSGGDNLYLARDAEGAWQIKLVATLSGQDEPDWSNTPGSYQRHELITSHVSTDGRFLAFMSDKPLTGYDNRDAISGQPDEEVYEYDARAGSLVCASCNPTGARPVGVFDSGAGVGSLLVDRAGAWEGRWLAGSIGGWREVQAGRAVYQPRNLVDGGRLFFESPDALVPLDSNGLEDVYEYEPARGPEGPSSNDCTSSSQRFDERSNGCVSLISAGTSGAESAFYDASASGDDAFFVTASKLVNADYDNSFDVYDAHVCSASLPCPAESQRPPECDSGDSCKAAPSPQPEIFGPAPSATFSGTGNVTPSSSTKPDTKTLTQAQKLARALTACRKKKGGRRRTCERNARGRYARKGKAGTRGTGR
jgi:Tol biopolymer transport system component